MSRFIHVPIAAALVLGAGAAFAQSGDSWSAEADGLRFWAGGYATDGSCLYVFGGEQAILPESQLTSQNLNASLTYSMLRRYDPVANAWTTLREMPASAFMNTGAYHDGRLYSFGGVNSSGITDGAIHVYTIATDTWVTHGAVLSDNRVLAPATTLNNKIYLTGGFAGSTVFTGNIGSVTNSHQVFDPAAGTLNFLTSPPATFGAIQWQATAPVADSGKLYAFGRLDFPRRYLIWAYEYNPSTDTWAEKLGLPDDGTGRIPNLNYAVFTIADKIYLTGGISVGPPNLKSTLEYNPSENVWFIRADMIGEHNAHAGVAIKGKGYVQGGQGSAGFCEEYTPLNFNQPPVSNSGQDRTIECAGYPGTSVTLDGTGSSDPNGDTLSYVWTGPFGTAAGANPSVSLPLGSHAITLKVTDFAGEFNTDSVTITIIDTTAPTLSNIPAPLTVEQANISGAPVTLQTPASSDVCDPSPTVTHNAPATFPLGTTTVTFTATDDSGNQSTATTTVTVRDTTPPIIAAPAGGSYPQGSLIQLGIPAVSDICDASLTVTNNAPATFGLGQTIVTWTAIDDSGNSSTATQTVTVFSLSGLGSNVVVGPGVTFGSDVTLQDGVTIGSNVLVGNSVTIKRGASIGSGSVIGSGALIKNDAVIGTGTRIGSGVTVKEAAQIGRNVALGLGATIEDGVVIEDGVAIGDNTKIKEASVIGAAAKIGKECQIFGVQVGAGASIGDGKKVTSNVSAGQAIGGAPSAPTVP